MSLQDDLLELVACDRRATRALGERDWPDLRNILTEYQALRKSLRARLLDKPTVAIQLDAGEVLRKICGGEGLATDGVIESLLSASDSDRPFDEFRDDEMGALGSDLLYSWFSHYEYITALAELRPLAVRTSVAESVSRLLRQVKDCYAFQQYDAAYGLCRTVLEASVRDICVRRRLFPDLGDNVVLFEQFQWIQLRDKVSSPGLFRDRLGRLFSQLCSVLHARTSASKDEARRAFEETLQVVEQLYAAHGL